MFRIMLIYAFVVKSTVLVDHEDILCYHQEPQYLGCETNLPGVLWLPRKIIGCGENMGSALINSRRLTNYSLWKQYNYRHTNDQHEKTLALLLIHLVHL